MWKRPENEAPVGQPSFSPQPPAPAPAPSRAPAAKVDTSSIGPGLRVNGHVAGDEDLVVEGYVEGKIELPGNLVRVGAQGRVKADIHGRVADIAGQIEGNVFAEEQVLVRASGTVRGNLTAPRVSLEDGAKFKGAIDMEPKPVSPAKPATAVKSTAGAEPAAASSSGGTATASGSAASEARPRDAESRAAGGARA